MQLHRLDRRRALGWSGCSSRPSATSRWSACEADPAHHGKVIDIGLWRYTRHPNYFGDACVWWGIFLVAAELVAGCASPSSRRSMMTLLLTNGSGARILEKHMASAPGWDEYAARTSMFFPLPPRH